MKPIINPMYFYLIETVGNIKTFMIIAAVILTIASLIVAGIMYCEYSPDGDAWHNSIKSIKIMMAIMCVCAAFGVFIPSSQTLTKMVISSVVTPNAVDGTIETAKELIDYIVEQISALK